MQLVVSGSFCCVSTENFYNHEKPTRKRKYRFYLNCPYKLINLEGKCHRHFVSLSIERRYSVFSLSLPEKTKAVSVTKTANKNSWRKHRKSKNRYVIFQVMKYAILGIPKTQSILKKHQWTSILDYQSLPLLALLNTSSLTSSILLYIYTKISNWSAKWSSPPRFTDTRNHWFRRLWRYYIYYRW